MRSPRRTRWEASHPAARPLSPFRNGRVQNERRHTGKTAAMRQAEQRRRPFGSPCCDAFSDRPLSGAQAAGLIVASSGAALTSQHRASGSFRGKATTITLQARRPDEPTRSTSARCVARLNEPAPTFQRARTLGPRARSQQRIQVGRRICLRMALSNASAGTNRRSALTCCAILPAV